MRCDIYDSFGHLSKPNNINRCCPKAPGKPATNINKQERELPLARKHSNANLRSSLCAKNIAHNRTTKINTHANQ